MRNEHMRKNHSNAETNIHVHAIGDISMHYNVGINIPNTLISQTVSVCEMNFLGDRR